MSGLVIPVSNLERLERSYATIENLNLLAQKEEAKFTVVSSDYCDMYGETDHKLEQYIFREDRPLAPSAKYYKADVEGMNAEQVHQVFKNIIKECSSTHPGYRVTTIHHTGDIDKNYAITNNGLLTIIAKKI